MQYQVKIILYPEVPKSKNGEFFERLMRTVFESQSYELSQNINFTGLEIDLYGKHKYKNEKLLVECKAKQEPKSTEIKNFLFNICMAQKADFGYFLHTEELHHQAAGLVDEWKTKEESKKFAFLGPKEIITILVDCGRVKPFSLDLPSGHAIEKLTLAYTYFGVYYIAYINTGSSITSSFCVIDASNLNEMIDLHFCPNEEFSNGLTFEQILRKELIDLQGLKLVTYSAPQNSPEILCAEIADDFGVFLENPGANFTHPQTSDLKLEDIFVAPDLKEISFKKNKKQISFPNTVVVASTFNEDGIKLVLLGNEVSGKTTICKYLFRDYYYKGFIPVLINGVDFPNNIRMEVFEKMIYNLLSKQYKSIPNYKEIPLDKIVVIFDDFHKIKIKEDYRAVLIQNICKKFKNIIITGNSLMPLESIVKNKTKHDVFREFDLYNILELGPRLRYEIVRKWNIAGQNIRFLDTNELLRKNDYALNYIESVIGGNYMPAYPFYILGMLQALEGAHSNNSSNYSQHGFYYELIINDALNKAVKDRKEISLFINYITSLCYYMFESKQRILSISEFDDFHNLYCKRHEVQYRSTAILHTLVEAKILSVNGFVSIVHNFVYYFFVAKYLTNNIAKSEIKEIVSKMCKRLYREEFGNIIMFLTHLSKDEFVINELIVNAKNIFSEVPIARIDNDVDAINQLVKELPKQVLRSISVEESREEELSEKEELERIEKEFDETKDTIKDYDIDESVESIDLISQFILALKNVEILGQIAKKYWGEMTGEQKYSVACETYFLSLRTLNNYLLFIEKNNQVLVEHIAHLIDKKFLKDRFKLEKKVEDIASDFVFRLCFLASFGVIRRVTNAIGYDKLDTIFNRIVTDYPINSVKLIDLSIKLEHFSKFPYEQIKETKNELKNNKLGVLVLRNLVINYMYLFNTDYKLKQKLCHLLDIDMKSQYLIDNTSKEKKE